MNLLSLVPSWVWAAAVAALAATSCKLKVDLGSVQLELEKAKVVHAEERAQQLAVLAKRQDEFRRAEQSLTNAAFAAREETNAQVLAARAVADDLRRRLRAQSANAATAALLPSATAVAAAETPAAEPVGAVLPLGVGEDLVSLAARAEELRLELISQRREYEAARLGLEALKSGATPQ